VKTDSHASCKIDNKAQLKATVLQSPDRHHEAYFAIRCHPPWNYERLWRQRKYRAPSLVVDNQFVAASTLAFEC
jgi:hypothetical protein